MGRITVSWHAGDESIVVSRAKALADSAIRFTDRVAVIHGTGKIGIRKSDSTVGAVAEHVAGRGLAVDAEEKAGLRIHAGVSPSVEDHPRDVAAWIEAPRSELVRELLPERALVLRERRSCRGDRRVCP